MDINEAQTLARYLMAKHLGTDRWEFRWSNGSRQFGYCDHGRLTIALSMTLTELNDVGRVRNTILHEIAHALAGPGHGHDAHWKRLAKSIGCDARRCYQPELVAKPTEPWLAVCPYGCGFSIPRFRRRNSACPDCCDKYNGGRFATRYVLQYIPNPALERMTANG